MISQEKNYAFIDAQNLNLGIQFLGWKVNYRRFRVYLREKYAVTKAYMFIGFLPENQNLYRVLQDDGFVLIFKPVLKNKDGSAKGNVDADLVLRAMIDFLDYDKAVIVTSDGDFYCLVDYLRDMSKLKTVISPYYQTCSFLLRKSARGSIVFLDNLKQKLQYIKNTA